MTGTTGQTPPSGAVVITKTAGVFALLLAVLPANLAVTGVALIRMSVSRPRRMPAQSPKTVLISGGKMTKALQLARSFDRAGHRVILVEAEKYRLTGHRFSNAVDRFYSVPKPQDPAYAAALLDIVKREGVDVYVPVCSPIASVYDALAEPVLSPYCDVIHCDSEAVANLDDKGHFAAIAASLGLGVPDTHRITDVQQVLDFPFAEKDCRYVLKSIAYDPVHRLDLTRLPLGSPAATAEFARSKPISDENPWILQEFVPGTEYCTHSTVRDGQVTVYCCCESSPFQINYEMVAKPEIETWVRTLVGEMKLTGQVSFDFIEGADGRVLAIECNPRTHSAITMFYDHPDLARAYLEDIATIRPLPSSRPTYWMYHELWRMVSDPRHASQRLRVIARGKDAIFDWSDPLPFLLVHNLQIPSLLLQNLRRLKPWIRIDFNIGKLVEPAGD